ncbi:MAG: hypothetical protein UZ18_ATM001002048 [Armatimonadetes bacterium OLB18]|nr:MAG: hypothetical protein UZ18_ATM001002048 [Armatimonadetes bacterium OLB18]
MVDLPAREVGTFNVPVLPVGGGADEGALLGADEDSDFCSWAYSTRLVGDWGKGARRSERQGLVQAGGGLDLLGFRLPRAEQIGRGGVSLKFYADGHPVDGQRSKYEG